MPMLLVVHHTPSPALQAMFEAAVSGARTDEVEGVEVVVRPALTAAAADVLTADGYLLGTPVQLALGTLRRIRPAREAAECYRAGTWYWPRGVASRDGAARGGSVLGVCVWWPAARRGDDHTHSGYRD
jgi:hypothetical protein